MPALPRKTQLVFGQNLVPNGNVAKFGSLAGGAAAYSNDPALIQTTQWLNGLAGALIGNRSPALEDLNGLFLVMTQQLAYLLQHGLPEWDASTTYWKNQYVRVPGTQFIAASLSDNNTNNNPATDSNNWDLTSQSCAIHCTSVGNQVVTIDNLGTPTLLTLFTGVGWNPRGYWNPATGFYTAPVKGLYEVNCNLQIDNGTTDQHGLDGFLRVIGPSGAGYNIAQGWGQDAPPGARWYPLLSGKMVLNAGDQIGIWLGGNDSPGGTVTVSNSFLSISRVS